jgi:integrase
MKEKSAVKLTLPVFTLTETCSKDDNGALYRGVVRAEYYYKPVNTEYGLPMSFNGVDMVICRDGSPWIDACLFLLERIIDKSDELQNVQKSNYASDLANFREFIEEYEIDYLYFPMNKMKRPTYRYRANLKSRVRSGEIAKSTAQRFMQTLISFYRWLISEKGFVPDNPPWNEADSYIHYQDSVGFNKSKTVKTTDVAIKGKSSGGRGDETIEDGGQLRPLTIDEQMILLDSLFEINNPTMTLIILMALFSGARIQTVLTLKMRHFNVEIPDDLTTVSLSCGPATGIDTKNDSLLTIEYPRWLHELISTYAYSDNATKRRGKWLNKTLRPNIKEENAYVFLTNRGAPYYEDVVDRNIFNPSQKNKYRADGSTVRTFMNDRLLPLMKKSLGHRYTFKFHDLRATFGMNLTDSLMPKVESKQLTLTQVRQKVRDRMGHGSYAVTDRYLGFRDHVELIKITQESYEQHLLDLVKRIQDRWLND